LRVRFSWVSGAFSADPEAVAWAGGVRAGLGGAGGGARRRHRGVRACRRRLGQHGPGEPGELQAQKDRQRSGDEPRRARMRAEQSDAVENLVGGGFG